MDTKKEKGETTGKKWKGKRKKKMNKNNGSELQRKANIKE